MVVLHCFLATSVANKNFSDFDTSFVNECNFALYILLGSVLVPGIQKCHMMHLCLEFFSFIALLLKWANLKTHILQFWKLLLLLLLLLYNCCSFPYFLFLELQLVGRCIYRIYLISLLTSPILSLSLSVLFSGIFPQQFFLDMFALFKLFAIMFYFSKAVSYILNVPLFIVPCSCFMDPVFSILGMIPITKYCFWSWVWHANQQNKFAKEHRNGSVPWDLVLSVCSDDWLQGNISSHLLP